MAADGDKFKTAHHLADWSRNSLAAACGGALATWNCPRWLMSAGGKIGCVVTGRRCRQTCVQEDDPEARPTSSGGSAQPPTLAVTWR